MAKEIIDSARKRFPGAAHGQPPPTAETRGCFYPEESAVFTCKAPSTRRAGTAPGGGRAAPAGPGTPSLPHRRGPNFGSGVSADKREKRCEAGRQEKRRASCAISHKGWPAAALGLAGPGAERDPPGNLSPPWAGGDSSGPHPSLVTGSLRKPLTGRLLPLFEALILSFPPSPPALPRRPPGRGCPLRSGRVCLGSSLQGRLRPSWERRRRRKGRGRSRWRRSPSRRGGGQWQSPCTHKTPQAPGDLSAPRPPGSPPRLSPESTQSCDPFGRFS